MAVAIKRGRSRLRNARTDGGGAHEFEAASAIGLGDGIEGDPLIAHNQYYVKYSAASGFRGRFVRERIRRDRPVLVPGTGVEPVRPRGPADFTYHHSFRYHASSMRFVVWTIPLPYAVRHLGRSRLVSTLSHALHGLSSGSPSARPVKGSPNLTPVHPRVSAWGTLTSPLRLPIPPPGQCRSRRFIDSRLRARIGAISRPAGRIDRHGGNVKRGIWRLRSESNRRTRLCRPLHDHSATQPGQPTGVVATTPVGGESGAGNETRTRDPNLGKVVLYQLSYSRRMTAYCKNRRSAVKPIAERREQIVRRTLDTGRGNPE